MLWANPTGAATTAWPCPSAAMFYIGLVLIVIGNGFSKANVSVSSASSTRRRPPPRRRLRRFTWASTSARSSAARVRISRPAGQLARRIRAARRHDAGPRSMLGQKHPTLADAPRPRNRPGRAILQRRVMTWGGVGFVAVIAACVAMFSGAFRSRLRSWPTAWATLFDDGRRLLMVVPRRRLTPANESA